MNTKLIATVINAVISFIIIVPISFLMNKFINDSEMTFMEFLNLFQIIARLVSHILNLFIFKACDAHQFYILWNFIFFQKQMIIKLL